MQPCTHTDQKVLQYPRAAPHIQLDSVQRRWVFPFLKDLQWGFTQQMAQKQQLFVSSTPGVEMLCMS